MSLERRKMPRIHAVVLPYLRAELAADYPTLTIGSWIRDVSRRTYPIINIRRLGGLSNARRPDQLDKPVIEVTAYGDKGLGLEGTEDLYLDARFLLAEMVDKQVVIPGSGHLHSFFETMGPTQFDSPYDDTFRIQGLIQLGLRPTRSM
jgi:hypothetical protein